jgi:hydrogenase maturation protease
MSDARILIAGIGNIFLGDDAFGVEVAQRLIRRPQPPGVRVRDFGIRGLDLTYALLDDCDAAILIDAVPRGEAPGTLYVIEPDPADVASAELSGVPLIDTHEMNPARVLRLVAAMGGHLQKILLVGCEPTPHGDDADMQLSLSPPVSAAIDQAVLLVESLVQRLLANPDQSEMASAIRANMQGETEHAGS